MEQSSAVSHQTNSGDTAECKSLHYPSSSHDIEVSINSDDTRISIVQEVSQAVTIMENMLNPDESSHTKGQPIADPHKYYEQPTHHVLKNKSEQTAMQEIPNGCAVGKIKIETLPLVEHSTNEKVQSSSEVQALAWVTSYDKVEGAVQTYEIETTSKFLLGNTDRDFGKTFDEIKHSHHIHLDGGGFGNEISPKLLLDGTPYIMMGNRKLTCHHGKPHNNSAKKVRGKHRLCTQASKKVGCPSHIIIRHVMLLPDFKFDVSKMTEHRRRELSKQIKATLKEKGVTNKSRFYMEFPDVTSHKNHPLGEAAGVKQPIDKRVNEKMLQLIGNGMKSIHLIEQSIKDFVREELFTDTPCPPYSNRRFFPTQKDIANRIFKVSASSLSSKLKMDLLEDFVHGLIEEQRDQDGFVFFRSALGVDERTIKEECLDEKPQCSDANHRSNERYYHQTASDSSDAGSFKTSTDGLLFVYQTRSQRQLLARYGSDLTFLDPAHRGADYAIPLYFLLVHTNCDFQIVAVIVTERESVSDLREALVIIKGSNPGWSPQQFVIDASQEDIQTVENLFPECRVFISDIRRQQAWERWLANPKHGTVNRQHELLAKMTAVAMARTVDGYQSAMEILKRTWSQSNLKLMRAWFREKWVSNIQRWAYVFRQQRQMLPLIMNNGIEAQHEALTYDFIATNRNCPLHIILDMLLNTTLPDMYSRYIQINTEWSTLADSSLPTLLHNRPKPFIDHCQHSIAVAMKPRQPSTTNNTNVISDSNLVDPSNPSCTCQDFTRTGYLCEHLLECITDGDDLLWEKLPSSYLFSPFLTVDDSVVGGEQEQILGAGDNEEEECANTLSGLSPEEEATSNLEAILAAVEAQTTSISTEPPIPASTSTAADSYNHPASQCQAIAKQLLDITHTVTDRMALTSARIQMEAALNTLRQALPREALRDSICQHEHASEYLPVHVNKGQQELDTGVSPVKKRRVAENIDEDALVLSRNHAVGSEISIDGNEMEGVYEVGHHQDIQESIITETIDLQHGAVFIVDPSGVVRNFQLTESETNTALTKNS